MPKSKDIIIYCVVLLFALEGLARLETFARSLRKQGNSLADVQIRDDLGTKGVPHGVWGKVQLNQFGFHDEDDYKESKKPGVVRVLCLGDSVTFGTHTPPDNWPRYLEESLRQRVPQVEIINTSMPGNNYPQIVDRFEAEWLGFEPDVVIMYKGFRSFLKGDNPKKAQDPWWQGMADISVFLNKLLTKESSDAHERLLERRQSLGIEQLVTTVTDEHLESYRKQAERLVELSRQHGFHLVLSSFPFLVNEGNRDEHMDLVDGALYFYPSISAEAFIASIPQFDAVTRELAAQEDGVTFADIGEGLERSLLNFADCYHLTRAGARHVASRFEETLTEIWDAQATLKTSVDSPDSSL